MPSLPGKLDYARKAIRMILRFSVLYSLRYAKSVAQWCGVSIHLPLPGPVGTWAKHAFGRVPGSTVYLVMHPHASAQSVLRGKIAKRIIQWLPALFSFCIWWVYHTFHIIAQQRVCLLVVCHWGLSLSHVQPNPALQAQRGPIHLSVSIQKDGNLNSFEILWTFEIVFFPAIVAREKEVALLSIYQSNVLIIASLSQNTKAGCSFDAHKNNEKII